MAAHSVAPHDAGAGERGAEREALLLAISQSHPQRLPGQHLPTTVPLDGRRGERALHGDGDDEGVPHLNTRGGGAPSLAHVNVRGAQEEHGRGCWRDTDGEALVASTQICAACDMNG